MEDSPSIEVRYNKWSVRDAAKAGTVQFVYEEPIVEYMCTRWYEIL